MALLLNHRIRFTEQVDAAMKCGDLSAVRTTVEIRRAAVTMKCRLDAEEATKRPLKVMQTLLKEQLDLVSEMMIAGDAAAAVWKAEMRFYQDADGVITCQCGEYEVTVGDDFPAAHMLVCTPCARQARARIFEAMFTGKVYAGMGPAGTGKTETVKDTMWMLGMRPPVINCSADMLDVPEEAFLDAAQSGGSLCPIILAEFNRCSSSRVWNTLLRYAEKRFMCITMNPDYAGRIKLPASIKHNCITQEMVPDLTLIYQV